MKDSLVSALLASIAALNISVASAQGHDPNVGLVPVTEFNGPTLEFEFPGLLIGVAEYSEGPTGTTIFYFPAGVMGAVDVRGGLPVRWIPTSCGREMTIHGSPPLLCRVDQPTDLPQRPGQHWRFGPCGRILAGGRMFPP